VRIVRQDASETLQPYSLSDEIATKYAVELNRVVSVRYDARDGSLPYRRHV